MHCFLIVTFVCCLGIASRLTAETPAVLETAARLCAAADEQNVYHHAAEVRDGNHWDALNVDFSSEQYPKRVLDMFRAMPRLRTLVVSGPRYGDSELAEFAKIRTLRNLVLDSTDVTDAAIQRLNRAQARAEYLPGAGMGRNEAGAVEARLFHGTGDSEEIR